VLKSTNEIIILVQEPCLSGPHKIRNGSFIFTRSMFCFSIHIYSFIKAYQLDT